MTRMAWIGLDTGADEVHICAIGPRGGLLGEGVVPNKVDLVLRFVESIAAGRKLKFAMESGPFALRLTAHLRERGQDAAILDAFQVSRFLKIRQNKTDKNDARGIAEALRVGVAISESHLRAPDAYKIRSQLVIRDNLVGQRVAIDNLLRSILRRHGAEHKPWRSVRTMREHVRSELSRLQGEGLDLEEQINPLLDLSEALRTYLTTLDGQMVELAGSIEICRRWMELPGVGHIVALTFYSAVDDPARFAHAKDVGPYLGMTPRVYQSGSALRRGRITKRGDRMTRRVLTFAASVTMRSNAIDTELKRWGLALKERVGAMRARTALGRKLAVVMLAMWKSGDAYLALRDRGAVAAGLAQSVQEA